MLLEEMSSICMRKLVTEELMSACVKVQKPELSKRENAFQSDLQVAGAEGQDINSLLGDDTVVRVCMAPITASTHPFDLRRQTTRRSSRRYAMCFRLAAAQSMQRPALNATQVVDAMEEDSASIKQVCSHVDLRCMIAAAA